MKLSKKKKKRKNKRPRLVITESFSISTINTLKKWAEPLIEQFNGKDSKKK